MGLMCQVGSHILWPFPNIGKGRTRGLLTSTAQSYLCTQRFSCIITEMIHSRSKAHNPLAEYSGRIWIQDLIGNAEVYEKINSKFVDCMSNQTMSFWLSLNV